MKNSILTVLFITTILSGYCQDKSKESSIPVPIKKTTKLSEEELKYWYHKDYDTDTIPGISLDKLYSSGLLNKKSEEVIVAVIDTKLDIDHEDLKGSIWINDKEIPENGIDDDGNGYIDDINGWDFLSNPKGEYIKYQSPEIVRIIRKYEHVFQSRDTTDINEKESEGFKLYRKAKKELEDRILETKISISYIGKVMKRYPLAVKRIHHALNKKTYGMTDLDSLLFASKDSLIVDDAQFLKFAKENEITPEKCEVWIKSYEDELKTSLNLDYNEREIIGDDPNDITDVQYGSNVVSGKVTLHHSILVSGVVGANRNNDKGAIGFSNKIKIMPVVMVASGGDELDKDIALAIRYAVDNGAKVINMSWGKEQSTNEQWVDDAIKYAAKNDVLLVHAAGNSGINTDKKRDYPNDDVNGNEIVDNFIVVGASGFTADENILASFSNYGQETVDVFAPGVKVYTTNENNSYEFSKGTSLSTPMVSGLAGLLRSYYPSLSAPDLKKIIMESGVSYKIPVTITKEDRTEELTDFSKLSKSGKIINAYNAFLMAEKINKTINQKK